MIESFAHRGLKRLYERGDRSGVRPDMAGKLERILQRLDIVTSVDQMGLPGFRLHPLAGDRKGYWSVTVNGNWRVTFRYEDGRAQDVNLVDYH